MTEPSLNNTISLVAGFWISLSALLWLLTLPAPHDGLPRIGFVSALYCAGIALAFCSAAALAFVMRKRRWPARTCTLAGVLFGVAGFLFMWKLGWPLGPMFTSWGLIASYIARKLAYPELTAEQVFAPEPPLTLFPK